MFGDCKFKHKYIARSGRNTRKVFRKVYDEKAKHKKAA